MLQGKPLFTSIHDSNGRYDAEEHLAQMIGLLGMPPSKFIQDSHQYRQIEWPNLMPGAEKNSRFSINTNQYFGGPFFDMNGKVRYLRRP